MDAKFDELLLFQRLMIARDDNNGDSTTQCRQTAGQLQAIHIIAIKQLLNVRDGLNYSLLVGSTAIFVSFALQLNCQLLIFGLLSKKIDNAVSRLKILLLKLVYDSLTQRTTVLVAKHNCPGS